MESIGHNEENAGEICWEEKWMGWKPKDGDYRKSTLIIGVTSAGNVGQLATELLIENVADHAIHRLARIFHPSLEVSVGKNLEQNGEEETGLVTSCELFGSTDRVNSVLVMQFRAPVAQNGREDFCTFLMEWIAKQKFKQIICLTSVFAADRVDAQLEGVPFRYLSTENTKPEMVLELKKMEWKEMEKRTFPAAAPHEEINDFSSSKAVIHLPGSGITKILYDSCEKLGLPFLAMIMFASEGDNTPEAMMLFQAIDKLLDWSSLAEDVTPSIPVSWTKILDSSPSPLLY